MPVLVAQEEMRRRQGLSNESFLLEMNLANGILNCNDQKYGILTMERYIKEKM